MAPTTVKGLGNFAISATNLVGSLFKPPRITCWRLLTRPHGGVVTQIRGSSSVTPPDQHVCGVRRYVFVKKPTGVVGVGVIL